MSYLLKLDGAVLVLMISRNMFCSSEAFPAGPRNTEKSSGPTSLPTRSTRTSDYMDSTRRQSYASKDIKPKQSSPRLIDARFDDVRCANTAMKRVGRDLSLIHI